MPMSPVTWLLVILPFLPLFTYNTYSDANRMLFLMVKERKRKDKKEISSQKALENFFFLTPNSVSKAIQNILMLQLFSRKQNIWFNS